MTYDLVSGEVVITATEFKAKCLDLLDRVNSGEIRRVRVTKRGKEVAVLASPTGDGEASWNPMSMFGAMKGSIVIDPSIDLDKPIYQQVFGTTVEADMGLDEIDLGLESHEA